MESIGMPSPELIWGLIPRFVGLIYVFAFGSLARQVEHLGGSRGQLPIQAWLQRVREDFPGVRRFFEYPTLFWWFRSDAALRIMPMIGVACGLLAIYGGTPGFVGLLLGWVLWLSMEPTGAIFPWDTMLMEAGFLALFLPTVPTLPHVHALELPLPTVAFMLRWLVIRLMLGFGKDKFIGVTHKDSLYLRGFFVWMPLPTPLGWHGHHAPPWFLKAAHFFMFYAEVIAPPLGLLTGWPRVVCYASLVALMLGIQLTGNWGFFNIAYIMLCTCLLDVQSSVFDLGDPRWAATLAPGPQLTVHVLMGLLFLVSVFYLLLDSWLTRPWVNWPANVYPVKSQALRRAIEIVHRALEPLRWLAPFRVVNGYGVFPPNSTPPLRLTPVFEGSHDGKEWKRYGYQRMPAFPDARPPFLAPGHARFDQSMYYFANGIHAASLYGATFPHSAPHMAYARSSVMDVVVQRLLEGDPVHVGALGHNPFPDQPPKLIRVGVLALTPTRPAELRSTGRYWHEQRLGTLVPARGKQTWPHELLFPRPEQFHPDYVAHRRRAPALRAIRAALAAGTPVDEAVLIGSDLTADDERVFWDELIPMLQVARGDWDAIHERARVIGARFDECGLYRLERLMERYVFLVRERVAHDPVAADRAAGLHMSNFRQHLALHACFLDGREAIDELLADPTLFGERARGRSDGEQLWVLGLLRYEQVMGHVAGFRWCEVGMRAHEGDLPGLFEYFPFLVQQTPPDEDFCPRPVLHDDGEHTIDGFYPPPKLT